MTKEPGEYNQIATIEPKNISPSGGFSSTNMVVAAIMLQQTTDEFISVFSILKVRALLEQISHRIFLVKKKNDIYLTSNNFF